MRIQVWTTFRGLLEAAIGGSLFGSLFLALTRNF